MTPASILYELADSLVPDGCAEHTAFRCWLCAREATVGMLVGKWQGANFTDQNKCKWPGASHVCAACVWACSWVQPPGFPPPAPGKKGLNLRLFSHFYDAGEYLALNKASKPEMLAWLRAPKRGPWFACIANTGQKHIVPWGRINHRGGLGGRVIFEEQHLSLPSSDEGWSLVDDLVDLLSRGVTKDELDRREYSARSWQSCPDELRAFDAKHGRARGGAWWALALFLSQRDEELLKERKAAAVAKEKDRGTKARRGDGRKAALEDGEGAARHARAVPRRRGKPAEALDADRRPTEERDADLREPRGVGERDGAGAPAPGPQQGAFDFGR